MGLSNAFIKYFAQVEIVLNSEPLLVHCKGDFKTENPSSIFGKLLELKVFENAVKNFNNCIEGGGDLECSFQEVEVPVLKEHSFKIEMLEINRSTFGQSLTAILTGEPGVLGVLNSPYQKYLNVRKASKLVQSCLQELDLFSDNWSYYGYETKHLILNNEEPYFLRLACDCCLVFHDNRSNYFALFTTGTD